MRKGHCRGARLSVGCGILVQLYPIPSRLIRWKRMRPIHFQQNKAGLIADLTILALFLVLFCLR